MPISWDRNVLKKDSTESRVSLICLFAIFAVLA